MAAASKGVGDVAEGGSAVIEFRIKEKTRSLNESFRGDWRPRAAVAKRQRTKAMQACPKWPGGPLLLVRLTRVSPGTLDGDAVPAALKHIRDGVASRLKIDDASPLVEWEYHQAKGEAEVVVQIWKVGEEAPPEVGLESDPVKELDALLGEAGLMPYFHVKGCKGPPCQCVHRGKALATVTVNAGKRLAVVREPGKGEKRAPHQRCGKNGCRNLRPCVDHDGTQKGWALGMVEAAYTPPLAAKAAREAEETFAPAPHPDTCRCVTCGPMRLYE